MKELGEALKSIFDKVSDFFDIFDLSFIVSGATSFSAIAFWWYLADRPSPVDLRSGLGIFATVMSCYVSGLACFAVGRWIRTTSYARKTAKFTTAMTTILTAHGLDTEEPFAGYLARAESHGAWRLYVRLWAELRRKLHPSPSLSLLNRYWVLAATYDGLVIAEALWIIVILGWTLGLSGANRLNPIIGIPTCLGLGLALVASLREAGRYVQYQVEELVATIAALREHD